jgi:hypothetical protein
MRHWPPIELDERTVDELQRGLDQLLLLGAEVAVVRADGGEVLAAAERHEWVPRRDRGDGFVHARRLWRSAALGVFARKDLDTNELEKIAERMQHVLRWGVPGDEDGFVT